MIGYMYKELVMNKIIRIIKQIRGLFPSPLPTGVTAFHAWSDDLQATYILPTEDKDSIRYTLATIIMHLGQQAGNKSKYFFYITLKAAAAKQVAGAVFSEIKEKQRAEAAKAAEEAAKAALVATPNENQNAWLQ